jgi:single-stranded DNA-specific DHH superfamily exonuclease
VYLPNFATEFSKENPDLLPENIDAFTALQATTMGKITRKLNFGLMDTTTNILRLIKYLYKATSPYDILEENNYTKQFHKRSNQLEEFLQKQIKKAQKQKNPNPNLIFFTYSGNTSMSSEIANHLSYKNPDKLIIVAFLRPEKANISIRGENALKITKKAIKNILGATGGGHENATGAMIPISDFDKFKKEILYSTQ